MDVNAVEIGIAAATNLAAAIWTVATVKANTRNLTGWVKAIDQQQKETHDIALATKIRVSDLPCRAGEPCPSDL